MQRYPMRNSDVETEIEFFVPAQVLALFGDPPLLRGEDDGVYYTLMEEFTKVVEPEGMVEWGWVIDITDHTWEIRRLRRLKVLSVELRLDAAASWEGVRTGCLRTTAKRTRPKYSLASSITTRVSTGSLHLPSSGAIAPFEIERRREHLARRLRKASDEIVNSSELADLPQ